MIRVLCFVCDAPARAFVKGISLYNSYNGCEYCRCKGQYVGGKVVFPKLDRLRTDASFSQFMENNQHTLSPICQIPHFNSVTSTPPEYMHSVCLGIMRKLLLLWTCSKVSISSSAYRLSPSLRRALNEKCVYFGKQLPCEFKRKIRSVEEIKRWKATELRSFLLYVGPVVLKNILSTDHYHHFILLHFSITVLASDSLQDWHPHAFQCLRLFVEGMESLYGLENVVYNVHCLLHLEDSVKPFGSLHIFSAFPFENALFSLKQRIRSSNCTLKQIFNRIIELEDNITTNLPVYTEIRNPGEIFRTVCGKIILCHELNGNICSGSVLLPSCVNNSLYEYPYSSQLLGIGVYEKTGSLSNGVVSEKLIHFSRDSKYFTIFPFISKLLN